MKLPGHEVDSNNITKILLRIWVKDLLPLSYMKKLNLYFIMKKNQVSVSVTVEILAFYPQDY